MSHTPEHSISRRVFLAKATQAAGGAFAYCFFAEGLVAEGATNEPEENLVKAGETPNPIDANFWIGGY